MSYTRATLAEFTALFPAFAAVQQAAYDAWVVRAERVVTTDFGDDQLFATELLTAHYLTVNGYGTSTEAQLASQGGVTEMKSGTLSLKFSEPDKVMGQFGTSSYGKQFWPLLRTYKGGPRVCGTGTQPTGVIPWA